MEAATLGWLPWLVLARLASLAASICSRVLTSGSDSFTFFLARATSRLCRFSNLLSILHATPYALFAKHIVAARYGPERSRAINPLALFWIDRLKN